MLKKRLASVLLIVSIFAAFSNAEDAISVCEVKLDECVEKCNAQKSEVCEETCEIEFNICLDTLEESVSKEISK
jgi:hypothetical protein